MLRKLFLLCFSACLSVMIITEARAQSIISGDITGTVTDQSGGVMPNAAVTLINVNTNTSQATITNQQGTYQFAFLAPGTYRVTVKAVGFQAQERTGIVVTAGQPTAVDVRLQLEATTQTVDVSEATGALQTENATASITRSEYGLRKNPSPSLLVLDARSWDFARAMVIARILCAFIAHHRLSALTTSLRSPVPVIFRKTSSRVDPGSPALVLRSATVPLASTEP